MFLLRGVSEPARNRALRPVCGYVAALTRATGARRTRAEGEDMITIRRECMDRAATENGSKWDAEATAAEMRRQGYEVQMADGDWSASYYADTEAEHDAMMGLADD